MSEKNFVDSNTVSKAHSISSSYEASTIDSSYNTPRITSHIDTSTIAQLPSAPHAEYNPNLLLLPPHDVEKPLHGGIHDNGESFVPILSSANLSFAQSRIPMDTSNTLNSNPKFLGATASVSDAIHAIDGGRVDGTFAMPRPINPGSIRDVCGPPPTIPKSQMMSNSRWSVPNPLAAFESDAFTIDESQGSTLPSLSSIATHYQPAATSSMSSLPQSPAAQQDNVKIVNGLASFMVNTPHLDVMLPTLSRTPQAPLPVSYQQLHPSNSTSVPQNFHESQGVNLSVQSTEQMFRAPRVAMTYAEMKAKRELMKQRQQNDQPTSVEMNDQLHHHRPPQQAQTMTTIGNTMIQTVQPVAMQPKANITDIQQLAQQELSRRRQLNILEPQNHSQIDICQMKQHSNERIAQALPLQKHHFPTNSNQLQTDQRFNLATEPQFQYQTNSFSPTPEPQAPHHSLDKPNKIQLTSEGRQALTKAILSALQSPSGTIEPVLLKNAVELTRLKESAIVSAGIAARHREQLKKLATLPASANSGGIAQDEMPAVSAPLRVNGGQLNHDTTKWTEPATVQASRAMSALKSPPPIDVSGKITLVGGNNIITSKAHQGSTAVGARSGAPSVYASSAYLSGSMFHAAQAQNILKGPGISNIVKPVEFSNAKPMDVIKGVSSIFPSNETMVNYEETIASRGNPISHATDARRSFATGNKTSLDPSKTQKISPTPTTTTPQTLQVIQPSKPVQAQTPAISPQLIQEISNWRRVQQAMFLSNAANVKGINFTQKVTQTPSWYAASLTIGAVVRCTDTGAVSLIVEKGTPQESLRRHRKHADLSFLRNLQSFLIKSETNPLSNLKSSFIKSEITPLAILNTSTLIRDDSLNPKRRDFKNSTASLLDVTDKYKRLKLQPRKDSKLLERNLKKSRSITCDGLNRKLKEINKNISSHSSEFFKFHRNRKSEIIRLARSVRDFFTDKAKKKDKDEENAERARIAALRANDMVAYTALLEEKRNDRLKFLLDKTGDFMSQISSSINSKRDGERGDLLELTFGGSEGTQSYYSSAHVKNESVQQPTLLTGGSLKDYQLGGLQWLVSLYNNKLNGILADEMGLGKTVQTIALIAYLMEFKDNRGPYLVIVPLSTMSNWVNEFRRWCPSITVIVYKGTPAQRKDLYKDDVREGHFNVLLTTYEYIIRDKASLRKIPWQYAIVDEGHRMKNAHSKFSSTLGSQYTTRHRLLLTGTPLQNNLPELWALLNFLLPSIFNSVETFDQWFNKPFSQFGGSTSENNADEVLSNEERLLIINRLHELLRPFMLRRIKADVLDQLPDKIERVIRCELSSWQKALYRQISYKVLENGSKTSARGLNNVAMQLRKVCNHPYMFSQEGYYINSDIIRTAGKVELLDRMLPKLKAGGHRILMFFQMTNAMTILEDYFKYRGYLSLRLDGSTPGEEREKRMALFNAPESPYFIFMLSTRAGGLGLNLASADTVIIFDSDWNPMMDLQAQDRAHRIGQKKIVIVFRLITNSPVEEKILSRATDKLNMSELIVEAGKFDKSSVEEDTSLERFKVMELLLTDFDSNPKVASSTLSSDDEADGDQDGGEGETEIDFNELLSRNDEDYELYRKIDSGVVKSEELFESAGLITDPGDIPDWIRFPNGKAEFEAVDELAIGHRAAKAAISYSDGLTDKQFIKMMEKQADDDEAASRERKRQWHEQKRIGSETVTSGPKADPPSNALPDAVNDRLISICKSVIALKEDKTKRRRSDIFREKPCPQTYPDYYSIIKHPIAINDIMHKCRSKSYSSLSEFLKDWEIMFTNAKAYNGEGSWIALDAMELDAELKRLLLKNNLTDNAEPQKSTLRIKISLKNSKDTSSQPEASKRKADRSLSPKISKKARFAE